MGGIALGDDRRGTCGRHCRGLNHGMDETSLIYDWNTDGAFDWSAASVVLNDETLRDGLQSPSAIDPPAEVKKRFLHLVRHRSY